MADTTRGWALAMIVVGILAVVTGLSAGRDASVAVGVAVLGFGVFSYVRIRAGHGPGD